MSFSIDNKLYRVDWLIKNGQPFPKKYSNRQVGIDGFGYCNVYVIWVGDPEWPDPSEMFGAYVPIKFYITRIIKPSDEFKRHSKVQRTDKPALKLLTGGKAE